jgi:hypothetical protein
MRFNPRASASQGRRPAIAGDSLERHDGLPAARGRGPSAPVLVLILGCCLAAPAGADTLPAPTTLAVCVVGGMSVTDPFHCVGDSATADVTLSPVAGVRAEGGASASASLEYVFEVVGGSAGDVVPVLITAHLETSAVDSMYSGAGITVTRGSAVQQASACTGPSYALCLRPSSFFGTLEVMAPVGSSTDVHLNAALSLLSFSGSGFASADPLIQVDPSFPGAADYSIVLSPGVANALAIPEASTLALLGIALADVAWRRSSGWSYPACSQPSCLGGPGHNG